MNPAPATSTVTASAAVALGSTAEQLRAHLLSLAPASTDSRRTTEHCIPRGLVDVRQAIPQIVLLDAPQWSARELRFLVRPEVAVRLAQAAKVLPADVRLGFWEGLRPLPVQQRLWESGLSFLRRANPGSSCRDLEATLAHYVAPPHGLTPPHSTGSAVDVAAVDAFGQVMNPADVWGRIGTEVLGRALRDSGLVNYDPEWWHWSYGDQVWASANDCPSLAFTQTPEFDGPGGGI